MAGTAEFEQRLLWTPEQLDGDDTGERIREENFDLWRTHIPDVFLMGNPRGPEPDMTRSDTRKLLEAAAEYFELSDKIKKLEELRDGKTSEDPSPRKTISDLLGKYPTLRGIRDRIRGFEVQLNPERENIWDEALLDQCLGDRRPDAAHKNMKLSIELSRDTEDASGFEKSVRGRMRRQGIDQKRLKVEKGVRVEKSKLMAMLASGDAELIPGTLVIRIKKWNFVPRSIPSTGELEEISEAS